MTLTECYHLLGGDYNEALGRFCRKEALAQRFVLRFPADPSFGELTEALACGDLDTAFRAAHTLKGVCANLSFTRLRSSASELTELLRQGELDAARALYPTVQEDYDLTCGTIAQLQSSI